MVFVCKLDVIRREVEVAADDETKSSATENELIAMSIEIEALRALQFVR